MGPCVLHAVLCLSSIDPFLVPVPVLSPFNPLGPPHTIKSFKSLWLRLGKIFLPSRSHTRLISAGMLTAALLSCYLLVYGLPAFQSGPELSQPSLLDRHSQNVLQI